MIHTGPSLSASGWRALAARWFVQFNPVFTASALCVLGGVLTLSNALGDEAVVGLSVALEAYQWLLIGTAALLYRRLLDRRPGVILGLIASAFLLDPTLQASALAASDVGPGAGFVWWLAFVAKVSALCWAFCVRANLGARILMVAVGGFLAMLPQLRVVDLISDATTGPSALAIVTLGMVARFLSPQLSSTRTLDDASTLVFARIRVVLAVGVVIGVAGQSLNTVWSCGDRSVAALVGATLLAILLATKTRIEGIVWLLAVPALGFLVGGRMGSALPPILVGVTLLALAPLHRSAPRVLVVGLCLAAWGFESLRVFRPNPSIFHILIVATLFLALVFIAIRRRSLLAAALVAVTTIALGVHGVEGLMTLGRGRGPSPSTVGLGLLAAGFVLIPLGVWLQRCLARVVSSSAPLLAGESFTSSAAGPHVDLAGGGSLTPASTTEEV